MSDIDTRLCIAGGGPAGLMAGLLFARAGVETLVLEKHEDFLRDFRGDTVHPSTLALFDQLGLLEEVLALPHNKVPVIRGRIAGRVLRVADFRRLPVPAPYIAMMPQWNLLDFVAEAAHRYPTFALAMRSEASALVRGEDGRVAGVRLADGRTIGAELVIAADGRRSVLREDAALPREELGAPMDVFWFRLPKCAGSGDDTLGVFARGRIVVLIDRGDYWQCAFVIDKGAAEQVKARGLAAFRDEVAGLAPEVRDGLDALRDWEDVKLLSVALDRLTCWHRPGLLAIGDAAHAMSPIGGVGINLAVQDAVAAANALAGPMACGEAVDPLLAEVQQRRWRPTVWTQALQKQVQQRIIAPLLSNRAELKRPPLALRVLDAVPALQRIPARVIGLGFRRERIESPDAFGSAPAG